MSENISWEDKYAGYVVKIDDRYYIPDDNVSFNIGYRETCNGISSKIMAARFTADQALACIKRNLPESQDWAIEDV